ncbi:MAG: signal peptide peptidase SppA [Nanoarchaeota archaeon]
MARQNDMREERKRPTILYGIFILLGLFIISSCVATIISVGSVGKRNFEFASGNVAHITISGPLTTERSDTFFGSEGTSSEDVIQEIEKVKKDKGIKAVLFEIDSPGGSPVASEEIGNAIKNLDMPTVSWIREVGASGAYWVASSTDHIVANRMAITGSIGVFGSYLEFPGLLTRFNITYRRLVSGKYKDMGVPYRTLEEEEEAILQAKLDLIHEYFIEEVAMNRNLSINQTRELATGMFYLGSEAKDLGLVDELGGKEEAIKYLEGVLKANVTLVAFERERSLWDVLSEISAKNSFYLGKGMSSFLKDDFVIRT